MLKAIGESINIRLSDSVASKVPIIIIGNLPITKSYYEKVDHLLKRSGIIQGFWSINPKPFEDEIVLNPFIGSGTTCIAALKNKICRLRH